MARRGAVVGGLLLLFVATRLVYLLLIDPARLLEQAGEEELYRGTIARELVNGLRLPFIEYRADDYSGGSLVIGAVAAGFFLLFGPTVLALKLAPLSLFTLAVLFWYWTVRRASGDRVARLTGVLFCLSPPMFTAYSVTAMGYHSESIVFTALSVCLLFKMLSEDSSPWWVPGMLGLTAGVGLWFAYVYGLTLLAMLLFLVWHRPWKFLRPLLTWGLLGFLIGFSPWIAINLKTQFAGIIVGDIRLWSHFGLNNLLADLAQPRRLGIVQTLFTLASEDRSRLYRWTVNLAYFLLFASAVLTAAVISLKTPGLGGRFGRRRPTLGAFAILYVVLFTVAVQFSDLRSPRYRVPLQPFVFFLVALAVVRCQQEFPRFQKEIGRGFVGLAVFLALLAHAPLLSVARPGYVLGAQGYTYSTLPPAYFGLQPATGAEGPNAAEFPSGPGWTVVLEKLPVEDRRDLSLGIVRKLAGVVPPGGQSADFSRMARFVPSGFEKYFAFAFGSIVMDRCAGDLARAVKDLEFLRYGQPVSHDLAIAGVLSSWSRQAALNTIPEVLTSVSMRPFVALSPHFWRAVGHLAGRYWLEADHSWDGLDSHLQPFASQLEPALATYFLQGVGESLFAQPNGGRGISTRALSSPYEVELLEGWGIASAYFELQEPLPWKGDESPFWTTWTQGLSSAALRSVQRGRAQFDSLLGIS